MVEALPKESLLQLGKQKDQRTVKFLLVFFKTGFHYWTNMAFHVTECNFSFFCPTVVTAQAERLADQMTSLRHRYALWPSALGQFRGYIRTPSLTASVRRITLHQGKESYCEMSSAAGPITNNTSFLWGIK